MESSATDGPKGPERNRGSDPIVIGGYIQNHGNTHATGSEEGICGDARGLPLPEKALADVLRDGSHERRWDAVSHAHPPVAIVPDELESLRVRRLRA